MAVEHISKWRSGDRFFDTKEEALIYDKMAAIDKVVETWIHCLQLPDVGSVDKRVASNVIKATIMDGSLRKLMHHIDCLVADKD